MNAKVISIAHRKGGVGKTCITLHLASALAITEGKRVVVLDTDSQQSAVHYRAFEAETNYPGRTPPYPITAVHPHQLFDTIRDLRPTVDVIFIDVPRVTENNEDSQLTIALAYCDIVLIPVVAGDLEGLSTLDFIKLIHGVHTYKQQQGFVFRYGGFLNKRNRRSENNQVVGFMQQRGISMFTQALSDVKALAKPYSFESVLQQKEGQRRFAPFFNEFKESFDL